MKLSVAEIISETAKFENDEDQINWLVKNDNKAVRTILKYWYDEKVKFRLPDSPPPYESLDHNNHGILYGKMKIVDLFVEGSGVGENLSRMKVEMKFIELLQIVHAEDAKLLCKMISKKPAAYLSKKTIESAYPGIFE